MAETVFLNEPYANVSTSKIVINGSTYATRNVGSVRLEQIPRPAWPWLIIVVGLLPLFSGAWGMGAIVIAVGAAVLSANKPKAKLHLMAGGGEQMAMESSDIAAVETIHRAVVEAISAR